MLILVLAKCHIGSALCQRMSFEGHLIEGHHNKTWLIIPPYIREPQGTKIVRVIISVLKFLIFVCGDVMEKVPLYITPLNVHRLFNQKTQPKTPFRGCTLQIKGTHT